MKKLGVGHKEPGLDGASSDGLQVGIRQLVKPLCVSIFKHFPHVCLCVILRVCLTTKLYHTLCMSFHWNFGENIAQFCTQ